MKRGRDEEKIMGPIFPRLHVNDTDKGGPRAPPRNKMALYEQLSIPSQRFSHAVLPCKPNNTAANFFPQSSQVPPMHPSEKQYSQYSDSSTPLAQVGQRKQKWDKDDFTVPIFVDFIPNNGSKYSNDLVHMDQEELSSSNPPFFFNHSFKFQHSTREEGKKGLGEKSEGLVGGRAKTMSDPSFIENNERNSSNAKKNLPSEDQNIVQDLSIEMGSREDGSCRSLQTGNLERGDSLSETSVLDNVSGPDITPDDVVGIIGQKHFWKARRAIVNQQRVFAVQVFELHRLIKVQRSIAASGNLLPEETAFSGKSLKVKKLPVAYAVKAIPNVSKSHKPDSEKQSHKKEASAENTVEKASLSLAQNPVPSPSCRPLGGNSSSPPSFISTDHNPTPRAFNQMQGPHQWLVPVMSPSEGLVYKPYPGHGFMGQSCGGCGPSGSTPMMMGSNFLTPAYGVPARPPQYHFPAFPPIGPHSYFPSPYGVPIMNTSAFLGSSVEQKDPTAIPGQFSPGETNFSFQHHNGPLADVPKTHVSEDLEVQASTESSPSETQAGSSTVEGRNMLPLFPTSPPVENSNTFPEVPEPGPKRPSRVIKVVPHNALSASESAARIFRSIQQERKQYDSA